MVYLQTWEAFILKNTHRATLRCCFALYQPIAFLRFVEIAVDPLSSLLDNSTLQLNGYTLIQTVYQLACVQTSPISFVARDVPFPRATKEIGDCLHAGNISASFFHG